MVTDRLGHELRIGDECICYSHMRTGSSSSRMVQYEGRIVGFTPKNVKVKPTEIPYSEYEDKIFLVDPDHIFLYSEGDRYDS